MDMTTCPHCGVAARVQERFVLESTEGPLEHARIVCRQGHRFNLRVETVALARFEDRDGTVVVDVPDAATVAAISAAVNSIRALFKGSPPQKCDRGE